MNKDIATDLLRRTALEMKDLRVGDPATQEPAARSFAEFVVGLQKLAEGLAMALDDSVKDHGSLALNQAYKSFYTVGQLSDKGGSSELAELGIGCAGITGALFWLFFSKAPAQPW